MATEPCINCHAQGYLVLRDGEGNLSSARCGYCDATGQVPEGQHQHYWQTNEEWWFCACGERFPAPEMDTPASVREKMKSIPTIYAMSRHYFEENHPGDYRSCLICNP